MPKVKTKKIVRKRFKITSTGKVMRRIQGARHLRRKKSKRQQRRQDHITRVENIHSQKVIKQFINT